MKIHSLVLLITLTIFTAFNAQAATEVNSEMQLEQSDELFQLLQPNYISEFSNLINQTQLSHDTSYMLSTASVSDSCVALMTKENFAGAAGARISQILVKHNDFFPRLMHGGSVNRYCRNYSELSVPQKSLVWVLLLTVIAHFESTCNPTAHAKGPNGTAYGYFQQHAGNEEKYDGDMNLCHKNSSRDPVLAGQCTLSMLEYQFQKDNGELFNNKSYWDVLRPNGRSRKAAAIQRALTQFSLCHPRLL